MNSATPSYYRRYWIVLLLRATTFSGVSTVPSDLFHRLVYFVNALMPAVGLQSETARVLKATYGPFFPDYQWDLDRLVGASLVHVVDFRSQTEETNFFGSYAISRSGVDFAEKIAMSSEFFSDVERAISEIVSAFVSTPRALSSLAPSFDANFGQDTIGPGCIIDFGEWSDDNYSSEAAQFLYDSWLAKLKLRVNAASAKSGADRHPSRITINDYSDSARADGIGQGPNAVWKPLTSSHPRRRAFHLYAHFLVQSLAQINSDSGQEVLNDQG